MTAISTGTFIQRKNWPIRRSAPTDSCAGAMRAPSRFQFVLHLMPDYVPGVLKGADPDLRPDQIKALVLTVRYDGRSVSLITGTAFSSFVLDKTLDAQWDKTVRQFLTKKGIACLEK